MRTIGRTLSDLFSSYFSADYRDVHCEDGIAVHNEAQLVYADFTHTMTTFLMVDLTSNCSV